jgi:uncharacterized protein YggE
MDIPTLQKRILGWAAIGLTVLLALFLAVKTNTELNTATTTNTVSFSGTGKVQAVPDVAIIDFSIVTEAATSKAAQDDNSRKSNAVLQFLKNQNISDKDVKTSGYNIYPQYDYTGGRSVLRGYQVSESIQVKVRDLTKTDTVLSGVVSAGANQVGQLSLTIDNPESLRDQAREAAIKDAGTKAKNLEHQLDIRLGHIVNFMEDGGSTPPIMYAKDLAVGMGGGGPAPTIAAGENEIVVNVTITYQIR